MTRIALIALLMLAVVGCQPAGKPGRLTAPEPVRNGMVRYESPTIHDMGDCLELRSSQHQNDRRLIRDDARLYIDGRPASRSDVLRVARIRYADLDMPPKRYGHVDAVWIYTR